MPTSSYLVPGADISKIRTIGNLEQAFDAATQDAVAGFPVGSEGALTWSHHSSQRVNSAARIEIKISLETEVEAFAGRHRFDVTQVTSFDEGWTEASGVRAAIVRNKLEGFLGSQKATLFARFFSADDGSFAPFEPVAGAYLQCHCRNCSGHGNVLCGNCSGDGQLRCMSCSAGKVACHACSGSGRTSRQDNGQFHYVACSYCAGGGRTTCGGCAGRSYIHCTACQTSGVIECRQCSASGIETWLFRVRAAAQFTRREVAAIPGWARMHVLDWAARGFPGAGSAPRPQVDASLKAIATQDPQATTWQWDVSWAMTTGEAKGTYAGQPSSGCYGMTDRLFVAMSPVLDPELAGLSRRIAACSSPKEVAAVLAPYPHDLTAELTALRAGGSSGDVVEAISERHLGAISVSSVRDFVASALQVDQASVSRALRKWVLGGLVVTALAYAAMYQFDLAYHVGVFLGLQSPRDNHLLPGAALALMGLLMAGGAWLSVAHQFEGAFPARAWKPIKAFALAACLAGAGLSTVSLCAKGWKFPDRGDQSAVAARAPSIDLSRAATFDPKLTPVGHSATPALTLR